MSEFLESAFARLDTSTASLAPADEWHPIIPVPADAPKVDADVLFKACPRRLRDDGFAFTDAWAYRALDRSALFYIVRLDRPANGRPAEKQIVPVSFCEGPSGRRRFHAKSQPEPRALFNLPRLLMEAPDAPVMVVEGEKAARAAEKLFPAFALTTSPGGSKAAGKADWSPLKGRRVTIVPDVDAPGDAYAQVVAQMAAEAGAASVRIAVMPDGLPQKWDLADDLPEGVTWADIERAVVSAPEIDCHKAAEKARDANAPLPLYQPLPPAKPFPVASLGPLATAAQAIANKVQVPLGIAGQSVLAAAALAAQSHANVRLPFGQERPLSLFFVTVAESGARKSTADNEALWPVYRHEKNLRDLDGEMQKTWRIAHAAWSAERKKIETAKNLDYDGRKEKLAELGDEPENPLAPFIVTADLTLDGLTKNWPNAHAGLGVFTAEGGVFTGSHGMSDDNKLRTAAMLSELWDGKPIKRVRAGDGVSILPGRRLSLHVMVQPDAAVGFLADRTLRDQGLLSRVLVSAPASLAGSRLYRETDPQDEASIRSYGARLLSILEAPAKMAEGKRNELEPATLVMSSAAERGWRDFFNHVESALADPEVRTVQDFAAKAAEHAARVAGVLTIYDNPNAQEIGEDAMACAVELVSWYVGEAIRLQQAGLTDPKLVAAQKLLEWLQAQGDPRISFRDIITYGPGSIRTKQEADAALAILAAHGWVQEESKRPRIYSVARAVS